jgi:hypothetical protein
VTAPGAEPHGCDPDREREPADRLSVFQTCRRAAPDLDPGTCGPVLGRRDAPTPGAWPSRQQSDWPLSSEERKERERPVVRPIIIWPVRVTGPVWPTPVRVAPIRAWRPRVIAESRRRIGRWRRRVGWWRRPRRHAAGRRLRFSRRPDVGTFVARDRDRSRRCRADLSRRARVGRLRHCLSRDRERTECG